ncbi:hypothetical protein HY250_03115 [Candidatus Azambacteria bacterium]|nr:hypothetical protein [Candidatus Azambacteria bacterium]MBI3685370.1 hypothetical protein [Candidatus Azambacteria bacterium]
MDPLTFFQSVSEGGDIAAITASPVFLAIKFLFIVAALFFFLHSIYLLRKTGLIGEKVAFYKNAFIQKLPPISKDELVKAWEAIQARMATMREPDWKLSIIEADKLLDELFRRTGYKGKDMGERMKQITTEQLSCINDVWKAHKVRNLLSHDINYHISFSEAQWVIETYKEALKEIGILAQ